MSKRIHTKAARASYDAFVGSHGTPHDREIRADAWFAANPDAWEPVVLPTMSWAERQAFKYRVEVPQPPPIVTLDSRGPDEGYDHFDFAHQHPALRR